MYRVIIFLMVLIIFKSNLNSVVCLYIQMLPKQTVAHFDPDQNYSSGKHTVYSTGGFRGGSEGDVPSNALLTQNFIFMGSCGYFITLGYRIYPRYSHPCSLPYTSFQRVILLPRNE